MSLDFYLIDPYCVDEQHKDKTLFWRNITHNLNNMAAEAGLYKPLWRPDEVQAVRAKDIIQLLEVGIARLRLNPEYFKQFNASNGWGLYENLLEFAKECLAGCKRFPNALIEVSR